MLIIASVAAATEFYVYPDFELYATGRVMESRGSFSKHNGDLMYGKDMPDSKWQGYFRFDLSELPDSLTVESAVLEYQAISVSNPAPHSFVTHVLADPLVADAATLWNAITTGAVVAPDANHAEGWIERPLDPSGAAAIQAGIADDYVTFGIFKWDTSDTKGHIKGYQAGRFKPRIRLELGARDVAVVRIIEPQGAYELRDTITPTAVVENHGDVDAPFRVTFTISTGNYTLYQRHLDVPGLSVGMQMSFFFPDWVPDAAGVDRVARVDVSMVGDFDADNDMMATWFSIVADQPEPQYDWGWKEMTPVPLFGSSRPVKLGGWLAANKGDGLVYVAKGNRTGEFAAYNPVSGRWKQLAAVPFGDPRVMPGKGARGASDGANSVYMVKGNKSTEFWRYDIAADAWERLPDLPLGPNSGPVRSGTGLVFVEQWGTGYVYLLKGPKGDLVRYDTDARVWEMLASAPIGNYNKWDRGSWLVSDGEGKLYAHKARKHELWTFDLAEERWDNQPRAALPLIGSHGRSLKLRDGGSATFHDGAIYSLKGGKSQEFWRYSPGANSWAELETMPKYGTSLRVVRMGSGGDFAAWSQGNALYAVKGNKSLEFWRYTFAPEGQGGQGGQAGPAAGLKLAASVSPTIARGSALVRLAGVRPGAPVRIALYDGAGRQVRSLEAGRAAELRLDLAGLSSGVYLVRVQSDNSSVNQKLVISH